MDLPSSQATTPVQTPQSDYNEKLAIDIIQQKLMASFENERNFNNSPPAYPLHGAGNMVSQQQSNQSVCILKHKTMN